MDSDFSFLENGLDNHPAFYNGKSSTHRNRTNSQTELHIELPQINNSQQDLNTEHDVDSSVQVTTYRDLKEQVKSFRSNWTHGKSNQRIALIFQDCDFVRMFKRCTDS